MKGMAMMISLLGCCLTSAVLAAGTLVQDDFSGLSSGVNISNSVLEAGSGVWTGTLVSDGGSAMQLADTNSPAVMEGAAVPLPDFTVGDVIRIKARIGYGSGAEWVGLGFSDSASAVASMSNFTPWGVYRPALGRVAMCGGAGVVNCEVAYTDSGAVTTSVFDIEFIYDTGAGTATTLIDGEIANEDAVVVTSGTPTLHYAFINFYRSGESIPYVNTYVESFDVSLVSRPEEKIVVWDDFSGMPAGSYVSNSVPEVGEGEWGGQLISDGDTVMRAPQATMGGYWSYIDLPEFDEGDIVKISATVGKEDGCAWWGIGFSNTEHWGLDFNSHSPWAVFYPGRCVSAFGGTNTFNSIGAQYRSASASDVCRIELIYDTGENRLTTIYDGEVVHDNEPIATSVSPTLDYAFVAIYRPVSGGTDTGTYADSFKVSVIPERHIGTVIWDEFARLDAGETVANSLPDVGLGTWTGTLISDGVEKMHVPASSLNGNDGGTVRLPDFHPGDIVSVKATVDCSDGAGWWGLGFTDKAFTSSTASMSDNMPWANFRQNGTVVAVGGSSTANSAGALTRASGAVSGLVEMELIYDTGAGTLTTVFDKEVVHDNVAITTTGTPTLDYAFIYIYDAVSGGVSNGTCVDRLEVSVTPAALADCRGTVVFWDDFDTGAALTTSTPETDVEELGWDISTGEDPVVINGVLIGDSSESLYAGVDLPRVGKYGVVSVSAKYKTTTASANWTGFGFGDGVHRLTDSQSGPWFRISGDGLVVLYGGDGASNLSSGYAVIPTNTFVDVKLTYDSYAQTASTWVDGVQIHTNVPMVHSAGTPSLDYALFQIRYADEVALDDFKVEMLPRREPLEDLGTFATTINVCADYGADPTDNLSDFAAISNALVAAKTATKPVNVVFDGVGTYVLDGYMHPLIPQMLALIVTDEVLISGNNNTIEIHDPTAGFLSLVNCENVIVEDLDIRYDPLPFTQGTVTRVDDINMEIDLDLDAGYPAPTNWWFENADRQWGWPIDSSVNGRVRDNCYLHYYYTDGIQKVSLTEDTYTIPIDIGHSNTLCRLPVGSRYALLARYGVHIFSVGNYSENCTVRNVDMYACPGLPSKVQNGQFISFINVNNRFDGNNLIAANGDAFHLQHARATWIENCLVQGLSDDVVNDYSRFMYVTNISGTTYTMNSFSGEVREGDRLLFVQPDNTILGEASVVSSGAGYQIVVDQAVTGVVASTNSSVATSVYNTDVCAGLYVADCDFRNSRRYGVVQRSRDSHIVRTSFCGLGSDAVYSTIWSLGEGGSADNLLMMDNLFINNGFERQYQAGYNGYGTVSTYLSGNSSEGFCSDLRLYRNVFSNWRVAAVFLDRATGATIMRNTFNASIDDEHVSENIVHDLTYCDDVLIGLNETAIGSGDVYVETNSCSNISVFD